MEDVEFVEPQAAPVKRGDVVTVRATGEKVTVHAYGGYINIPCIGKNDVYILTLNDIEISRKRS